MQGDIVAYPGVEDIARQDQSVSFAPGLFQEFLEGGGGGGRIGAQVHI